MKVKATSDNIRKLLRHPIGGAFREDGSAEWPDDSFTYRRIQDGDVTAEGADQSAAGVGAPTAPEKKVKKE